MLQYFELRPPQPLASTVECFWVMRQMGKVSVSHRVVPDGCADILFTRAPGSAELTAVGAMTHFEDFDLPPGQWTVGVRFRPGMWSKQLGVTGGEITDRQILLQDLWGKRARSIEGCLGDAATPEECVKLWAREVAPSPSPTAIQRAIAWMEQRHCQVSLDQTARHCGLSVRQFRRVCLEQTGLSPKFLARVLRFRHALTKVRSHAGAHAGLAAECGYFDQSHLIAEFRCFSGRTPTMYSSAIP